jgi:hypothetical protein
LNPDGTAFEVLHVFTCVLGDGCRPLAGLTASSAEDPAGWQAVLREIVGRHLKQ